MSCDTIDRTLQLEAFRPLREIRSWTLYAVVELISGRAAAHFPRAEAIGSLEVLRFYVLIIDCTLLAVFVIVMRIGVRSLHLEDFLLRPCFLITGPSSLSQIGLVVLK